MADIEQATEGTGFISSTFSSQYTGATNAGFIRGGYHFAHPDSSSGSAQADYFLAHGGGWSGDGITLPVCTLLIVLLRLSVCVYTEVLTGHARHRIQPQRSHLLRPLAERHGQLDQRLCRALQVSHVAVPHHLHDDRLVEDVHGQQRGIWSKVPAELGPVLEQRRRDPCWLVVSDILAEQRQVCVRRRLADFQRSVLTAAEDCSGQLDGCQLMCWGRL